MVIWAYFDPCIIDDEGVIYQTCAMGPHYLASELMKEKSGGNQRTKTK